jgi:hypothetical protein
VGTEYAAYHPPSRNGSPTDKKSGLLAESLGGFRYGPPENEAAMKY